MEANDLASNQKSNEKATSVIDLASSVKGESRDVSISSIILRTDDKQLHEKGGEVNDHLTEKCKAKNLYLIDNLNRTSTAQQK